MKISKFRFKDYMLYATDISSPLTFFKQFVLKQARENHALPTIMTIHNHTSSGLTSEKTLKRFGNYHGA